MPDGKTSANFQTSIGYQGYLPAAVIMTYQPGKRLKNREGRDEDKSFNRQVSAIRVEVEDAIGSPQA